MGTHTFLKSGENKCVRPDYQVISGSIIILISFVSFVSFVVQEYLHFRVLCVLCGERLGF